MFQKQNTTGNKTNPMTRIDETVVFRRLWSKKIFIFIVTGLSFVLGLVFIPPRPVTYTVDLKILFKAKDAEHMGNLFHYGDIDFALYPKTGEIEKGDSLQFTPNEQELLWQAKNKIAFEASYLKRSITLSGNTTDTLVFIKELETIGRLLRKNMTSLFKTYALKEADSLYCRQNEIQTDLEEGLRKLMKLQEQYPNSQDFDTRMKVKLAEYEYASLCIPQFAKLEMMKQSEKQLKKMEITLSSPHVQLSDTQSGRRFILMRWLFFCFVGSCIWVLGSFHVQLLLKKRKG